MFKRYLTKIKEFAAPVLNDISRQQFIVTSISAAVMLAGLIVFWNWFILPHQLPPSSQSLSGSEAQVSLDGGSGGTDIQKNDTGSDKDAFSGDTSGEKVDTSSEAGGNTGGAEQSPGGETLSEKSPEDANPGAALPQEPDMSRLQKPLQGKLVRKFGFVFSPKYKDYRFNGGIDVSAGEGTPVNCALEGVVEQVALEEGSSAYIITVNHGGDWKTVYGNIESLKVEKGSRVASGSVLGYLGAAGSSGVENSLHLELIHKGEKINPLNYFDYKE